MKLRNWIVFLLVVAVGLFCAAEVFARAGGGGGYSGGGGGGGFSGGSSGGGGGDGIAIYLLLRAWLSFCIRVPWLGIPLTIVFIYLFFRYGKHFKVVQQGRTIAKGRKLQEQGARDAAIAQLKVRDPDFNAGQFYQRISKGFVILQEAWSEQDLSSARMFVSDGIIERFTLQFQEQKDKGFRNRMDDINVQDVVIAQVESDAVFDTITVRITASAVDYFESLSTGKRISGNESPASFTEYWSFVRRPGAKSLAGDGLIEGNCPNCGAGLSLNESGKCKSCGAVVKSGEYDWVLTEITQACEWSVKVVGSIPGVAALREKDPGLSVQNLEDRASVMYWRFVTALRTGRVDVLRKMALESYCNVLKERLQPDENGQRRAYENCAVGRVDTEGILQDEDYDRAVLGVRWSGAACRIDREGTTTQEQASHVIYDLFVLVRKHGVLTDVGYSLTSAHCPSCGAAMHNEAASACEYCGAVLNDGSSGWVLENILSIHSNEAAALRQRIMEQADTGVAQAKAHSKMEQVAWMIQVMLADGQVDAREMKTLEAFAAKHAIPAEKLQAMISAMKAGHYTVPEPKNAAEANEWLERMAEMVLADGKVTAQEKRAMLNMAARLNLAEADINNMLTRKRMELYQAHKTEIRKAKKNAG